MTKIKNVAANRYFFSVDKLTNSLEFVLKYY